MLNHSVDIFEEIVDYLSLQNIPCHTYDRVGIITFSAATAYSETMFDYRVNVAKNEFWLEVTAPVKVPQSEKIQVRLLKFINYVNRADRSGGFLVLDRDAGKLLCCMMVPFSDDRCGRIDQILPVPASMLNHYCGAIGRLIQGTSSVEMEVKTWKNVYRYRDISPLRSSLSLRPVHRFPTRRGFMDAEVIERYINRKTGED